MDSTLETTRLLVRRLGSFRGPTRSGWLQFHHKPCGDRKFRLGVSTRTGKAKCFHCAFKGHVHDLVPEIAPGRIRVRRVESHAPRPGFDGENPESLPWKRIRPDGPLTTLERGAVEYLASRGISRVRAAVLGLGYGIERPYIGTVIHPWFRDDGSLGGWQARKTWDPADGSPKIIHALPSRFPSLFSPSMGAMFCYDLLPTGSPVLLVEGPYDTYSGLRVIPTVGLMGSVVYPAQIRRLQRKRPSRVVFGLDPDTFLRQRFTHGYQPPKARAALKALSLAFDVPIRVLRFPLNFDGDLGGRGDKRPHHRRVIERLIESAEPYEPASV